MKKKSDLALKDKNGFYTMRGLYYMGITEKKKRNKNIKKGIQRWMETKDNRKKKLITLWSEEVEELTKFIIKEIDNPKGANK